MADATLAANDETAVKLCPFCGAYSPRKCELEGETGGTCPWEELEDE